MLSYEIHPLLLKIEKQKRMTTDNRGDDIEYVKQSGLLDN